MFIPSLLILILLVAPFTHAYTVITTNGKRISGTFVSDNQQTILIKDTQGFVISFKKHTLDLDAMQHANVDQIPKTEPEKQSTRLKREPSLVELAEQVKSRRKGASHLVTMDDLTRAPEISVLGSDLPASTVNSGNAPDETKWASRLNSLKKEVNRLMERKISAESGCNESRRKQFQARTTGHEQPSDLMSTYKETTQCSKFKEIARQLEEAQTELDDAREEGRKAGVSWQTLE